MNHKEIFGLLKEEKYSELREILEEEFTKRIANRIKIHKEKILERIRG